MASIEFYKLQASGNDFVLVDNQKLSIQNRALPGIAKKLCQRKFGIGADGLLVIERSKKASFKMRIFNPDGSEPSMCGNGARCAGLWAHKRKSSRLISFETKAGFVESVTRLNRKGVDVKIRILEPKNIKLDLPLKVLRRKLTVNSINTGVPHVVIFVEGLDKIDIERIGRAIRFHAKFKPQGTNVNFVEITGKDSLALRTYERGVEEETLACGTGVVASAIVTKLKLKNIRAKNKVNATTRSREKLRVYFDAKKNKITNVWLEGKAYLVYKGQMAA